MGLLQALNPLGQIHHTKRGKAAFGLIVDGQAMAMHQFYSLKSSDFADSSVDQSNKIKQLKLPPVLKKKHGNGETSFVSIIFPAITPFTTYLFNDFDLI